jgi:phosphoglycerate dehydrogenase-like enzyme
MSVRLPELEYGRLVAAHPDVCVLGGPGGVATLPTVLPETSPWEEPDRYPEETVGELLRKADAVVATRIPDDLVELAPRLRWLQFTSAGIDHVWKPCLDRGSVVVTNAKGLHGPGIAEFVAAGLLHFARDVPQLVARQRQHQYRRFVAEELAGRSVAIMGFGAIGRSVGRLLRSLGMRVIGFSREPASSRFDAADEIASYHALRSILPRIDVLVAALPSARETAKLISADLLGRMRATAILVNVGRGQTVDEAALTAMLREGRLKAAILDVQDSEPLPGDSPLWDMPNVLLSPHMAGATSQFFGRLTDLVIDNLGRFMRGEALRNQVRPNGDGREEGAPRRG